MSGTPPRRQSGGRRPTVRQQAAPVPARPGRRPPAHRNAPRVPDMTRRIRSREAARRRRRGLSVGAGVLVLLAVLAGLWVVYFSAVFAVTTIDVQGNSVLSRDEVLVATDVREGTPLARADGEGAQRRLAVLPAVESVSVKKVWPHTLRVSVTERTGVYALGSAVGYRVVDRFGIAFRDVDVVPQGMLWAEVPPNDERLLRDVATVIAALPPAVVARADHVVADTPDHIVVVLDQGQRVVWGSAEDLADKARVLQSLLEAVKAKVYDVSSPSHPATRND